MAMTCSMYIAPPTGVGIFSSAFGFRQTLPRYVKVLIYCEIPLKHYIIYVTQILFHALAHFENLIQGVHNTHEIHHH